MHSFRRLALLLAIATPAMLPVLAQNSSSPSTSESSSSQDLALAELPSQTADAAQAPDASQQPNGQSAAQQSASQLSVQARIRARREQRRAAAMHDIYAHRYELFGGIGYLRFQPGPSLQRLTFYSWDVGGTRYFNERLGISVDGRGYYGIAYVGLNPYSQGAFTRPKVSEYDAMAGPTYRFYMKPKYSISGRVMGGYAYGNFSGDTNGISPTLLGIYPDSSTFAADASIIGEVNLSPNIGFRLAPEYFATGFGSNLQGSVGFTGGIVFRFGKQ